MAARRANRPQSAGRRLPHEPARPPEGRIHRSPQDGGCLMSPHGRPKPATGFRARLVSLTRKEVRQLLRDRSNIAFALLLPIVLILLFGYGISMDLPEARVAVVDDD